MYKKYLLKQTKQRDAKRKKKSFTHHRRCIVSLYTDSIIKQHTFKKHYLWSLDPLDFTAHSVTLMYTLQK